MRALKLLLLLLSLLAFASACPSPVDPDRPDAGVPSDAGASDAGASDAGSDAGTSDAGVDSDFARLDALVVELGRTSSSEQRKALVQSFFEAVSWGETGLPLRATGRFGVALYDERGGSFAVAGEFNAWSTSADPLLQPVSGFGFYYRIGSITGSEPLSRTLYKFVRNGAEYFADPWARRRGFDQFGEYSLLEVGEAASHLERWRGFDDPAGQLASRDLTVYVPAAARSTTTRLPAIYMHDGQNLFDPAAGNGGWRVQQALDQAISAGEARAVIVVGIDNTFDRIDEYTHVSDDILSGPPPGGRSGAYATLIAEHIKPFVDSRYPTLTGKADTAVAGSSLGGLVSFDILRRHRDAFGHAAALSATFGWGSIGSQNATMMSLYASDPPTGANLYLDSGGNDGGGCLDQDGDGVSDDRENPDNYCETLDMKATLEGLGWSHGMDLRYVWAPNAGHHEGAWAERFPALIRSWFPGP